MFSKPQHQLTAYARYFENGVLTLLAGADQSETLQDDDSCLVLHFRLPLDEQDPHDRFCHAFPVDTPWAKDNGFAWVPMSKHENLLIVKLPPRLYHEIDMASRVHEIQQVVINVPNLNSSGLGLDVILSAGDYTQKIDKVTLCPNFEEEFAKKDRLAPIKRRYWFMTVEKPSAVFKVLQLVEQKDNELDPRIAKIISDNPFRASTRHIVFSHDYTTNQVLRLLDDARSNNAFVHDTVVASEDRAAVDDFLETDAEKIGLIGLGRIYTPVNQREDDFTVKSIQQV